MWWYVHRAFSPLRATIAAMQTLTKNEGSMAQQRAETELNLMNDILDLAKIEPKCSLAGRPADALLLPSRSPGPQDTAALDAQTIDALKTLCPDDSTAFLQELITPFLQETSAQLADLNTAVDAADTDALDYTAHALKGSCTYMGAHNMVTLCQNVQLLSRQPVTPMADIIATIKQLTAEFDRVRHALEAEASQPRQLRNDS